jgi:hypothetical protein
MQRLADQMNFSFMAKIVVNIHISRLAISMLYLFFYFLTLTANGFLPGGSGTTIRQNTQITHIALKQNCTNNEHTTHNEYNGNTITTTINKK